jgi:5-formyltetrahydrofolate cyclo-ligase
MASLTDDRKERLRREARARRDACAAEQRAAWSLAIAQHGAAALRALVGPGTVVSAYWPMRSEADPRPLARALAALGARLALPAFVEKHMLFRAWPRDEELVPAGFQTFEPPPTAPELRPALVLAPLLAFDARGARLGWGKGYYDTALGALDAAAARGGGVRPFVCGVAFACQEAPEVPLEPHDRRLDAVVTELGYRAWGTA